MLRRIIPWRGTQVMEQKLERAIVHFASSAMLVGLVAYALHQGTRYSAWLPGDLEPTVLLAGTIVFAVAVLREAYDVWRGQSLTKAVTDYVSWACGCAFSAWGLYRFVLLWTH